MMKKNIVFMGTSEFSVEVMRSLLKAGCEMKAVYTRPDSAGGRGQKLLVSPVKKAALDSSLPLRQPETLRNAEEPEYLKVLNPDAIIVAAYGLILPKEVLELPPFGCVNVHPSLLPRHRGPSPIPAAILAGDEETGVSIMLLDRGVDTGPVLGQERLPIGNEDTTETLTRRLAELGGSLLLSVLPDWFEGKIAPVSQDRLAGQRGATYSAIIKKEDGEISWNSASAREIWLKVRAFYPWPGCHTRWKGKILKILRAELLEGVQQLDGPGKVVEISPEEGPPRKVIGVAAKEGVVGLETVQYEGGRPMSAGEFARGHRDFVGSLLPQR